MKTAILATALALTTSAASAEIVNFGNIGVSAIGSAEYAFEAEAIELTTGTNVRINSINVIPTFDFIYTNSDKELDFTGATVMVNYTLNENFDVYAEVEADSDFEYQETVVGIAFSF